MDTATRTGLGANLAGQFGIADFVIAKNLDGLNHEVSIRRPSPGGNSLNWVVGHMADARNKLAIALTEEPVFAPDLLSDYEGKDGSGYSAEGAIHFDELKSLLAEAGEAVVSALSSMTDEALARPAPFSVLDDPGETLGSLTAIFAFHDAYHAGQTGILRRACGLPGVLTPPDIGD